MCDFGRMKANIMREDAVIKMWTSKKKSDCPHTSRTLKIGPGGASSSSFFFPLLLPIPPFFVFVSRLPPFSFFPPFLPS